MRMRKKKWVEPFLKEEKNYLIDSFNSKDCPVYLEIGMGMGDFITESAFRNHDVFYVGLEKDETCVARAIKKAEEKELTNFSVLKKDAKELPEIFKEKSVDRIYLHFSDPWPKKSHHKRRLTYPTFLKLYESILKDKGELIIKTDNLSFFEDSLEYFKESNFIKEDENRDYHSELIGEPMTAYQEKFMKLGNPIYYAKYHL